MKQQFLFIQKSNDDYMRVGTNIWCRQKKYFQFKDERHFELSYILRSSIFCGPEWLASKNGLLQSAHQYNMLWVQYLSGESLKCK